MSYPTRPRRGRLRQRLRTRKDLLSAAARLLHRGTIPTMAQVAEEARVSRSTAYRHFGRVEAILLEAPLSGRVPKLHQIFGPRAPSAPEDRLGMADAALGYVLHANEARMRVFLSRAVLDGRRPFLQRGIPVRPDWRLSLIEEALAPARAGLRPGAYARLRAALALVLGVESMIVFRDVVALGSWEARDVKQWMIETLVAAAR